MSHYCVMVVTENEPTQKTLVDALAPYHEFESTGEVNEYVLDIDITAKVREEYEGRFRIYYSAPDGTKTYIYDDSFFRDPTEEEVKKIGSMGGSGFGAGLTYTSKDWGDGKGYRMKIHHIPDDCEKVDVPVKETQTFLEYVQEHHTKETIPFGQQPYRTGAHKWGWIELDRNGDVAKIVDRTNPNAKWDWWQVGGRFSDYFITKQGGRVDSAQFSNIDWVAMRKSVADRAGNDWDMVHAAVSDAAFAEHVKWKACKEMFGEDLDKAREFYNNQRSVKELNEAAKTNHKLAFTELDNYCQTREEHYTAAYENALTVFAFVRNGDWHERGNMGWWATVTNENPDWHEAFNNLLENVSYDHWLTIVDCHI